MRKAQKPDHALLRSLSIPQSLDLGRYRVDLCLLLLVPAYGLVVYDLPHQLCKPKKYLLVTSDRMEVFSGFLELSCTQFNFLNGYNSSAHIFPLQKAPHNNMGLISCVHSSVF